MKKKTLILLRTSTEAQELESQRKDMISFARSEGFKENELIFIEAKGASAIKMNKKYQELIGQLEEYVKSGQVGVVMVWALNRLGRVEEELIKLKNMFIEYGVNLICKEPGLRLLNPDGTVNAGMELAYSFFATMSKLDGQEIKKKTARGKKRCKELGKFTGGKHTYGYNVDENGYYVEHPVEGSIVREMFQLYSTGKYSVRELVIELNSRGAKLTNPTALRILSDRQYIGPRTPSLVSEELFNKCAEVRKDKNYGDRGERALGARIIRCHECGCAYVSSGQAGYRCSRFTKHLCPNSISLQRRTVDYFLTQVADTFFLAALGIEGEKQTEENKEELKVLKRKLEASEKDIESIQTKKDRVVELYIEGALSKEKKDERIATITDEERRIKRDITSHKEQIRLLKSDVSPARKLIEGKYQGFKDNERLWEKVHEFIRNVTIERDGNNYILKAYDYYNHCVEAHYKPYPKGSWKFYNIQL